MIIEGIGDATDPFTLRADCGLAEDAPVIIAHVTNNCQAWGAGFTGALTKRFGLQLAVDFRDDDMTLGGVDIHPLDHPHVRLANMCAQDGIGRDRRRIDYDHLADCLYCVFYEAAYSDAYVLMPRIGSGLGGGDWDIICPLIDKAYAQSGMTKNVYILRLQ